MATEQTVQQHAGGYQQPSAGTVAHSRLVDRLQLPRNCWCQVALAQEAAHEKRTACA